MSYFVIKGPAGNNQYLGPEVSKGTDYGCPQWVCHRADAVRFPDSESAWEWLDAVQRKHEDAWYQGRAVRVNTIRDWRAERERLLAEVDRLRFRSARTMTIQRTVDVDLSPHEIAEELAEMGSTEQAIFFTVLAQRFRNWTAAARDQQLLYIAESLEPDAVEWLERLHMFLPSGSALSESEAKDG